MAVVTVPFGFNARAYQKPLYNCLYNGKKRGLAVWHRRAGKDKVFMAMLAAAAMQKVGIYFYILPYYKQARKVIWEGMDSQGVRNLAVFPDEIISHKNNQEMILTLINGSMVYFLGSDNIDSIVGTNPIGVFFSEYSLHKPQAWDFLRPILVENGGFAFFNGTPRGKNHMYKMLKAAENDTEEWFAQVLTIEDTDVMTAEQVEKEIREGMDRATAKQEFYCSFDAALSGAYYDEAMGVMEAEGRISNFPIDPYTPVDVAWDLGMDDTMVLTFYQVVGMEVRIIDVIANNSKGLDWYVKELQRKPYIYGNHYLPHDIRVRELGNGGKTRLATLYDLGLKNLIDLPKSSLLDGINEVRKTLYRTYIHKTKCDQLIEALKSYRREWDPEKQVYSNTPVHDWASHFADSVRNFAMGHRAQVDKSKLPEVALGTGYDPVNQDITSDPFSVVAPKPRFAIERGQQAWNPLDHIEADGGVYDNYTRW